MPFKDPARRRAYQREWIARNAERHREQSRAGVKHWRLAHPEQHRGYRRHYYALNSDRLRAQAAAWHRAHPEVHRLARQRRRARVAKAVGDFGVREWLELVQRYDRRCGYCGLRSVLQPDHRIPLGRGGSNAIENIIPACAPCNQRKGLLTEADFRERIAKEARR